MPSLFAWMSAGGPVPHHHPWPRVVVDPQAWTFAAEQLAAGRWTLSALWGESDAVHMALHDEPSETFGVVSLECPAGAYPSIGRHHPPALRLERAVADLFGLVPVGLPDTRPWLDHGRWPVRHPLAHVPAAQRSGEPPYAFLPSEGQSLHQIAVGPVHAGIIEPGHFRFTANGETVVRLEARLGYTHKGIEALMAGADLDRAARLAGRISGDSTVAFAWAFAQAVEAALGCEPPSRAVWLRALMAELERIANHLGDIGAICNDAAFALMLAHCGVLRELVLRAANVSFGHRLIRDCVVPGGVTRDLGGDGVVAIGALVAEIRKKFPALVELYDNTASLQDRTVSTGFLKPELARQYGAGGYVGRASGRPFDARRSPGYAPYAALHFEVATMTAGDVDARVWVRIREVEQSLSLIDQILSLMPDGPVCVDLEPSGGVREGVGIVEGFRGDVLVWVRLGGDNTVLRCHPRDPSWFHWPLLEAVIEGNIVADFPLCNKSFNCSYSGHDL